MPYFEFELEFKAEQNSRLVHSMPALVAVQIIDYYPGEMGIYRQSHRLVGPS
jgi:hypothetical protein